MQSGGDGKEAAAAANGGGSSASANAASQQPGSESRNRYRCLECGKGFITPSKLQRHTYSHTGQRPFHCDVCGKSFSQSANLKTHIKNTHPELLHSGNLKDMLRPSFDTSSSLVEQVRLMAGGEAAAMDEDEAAAAAAHSNSPSPH